ncbi:MAG: hypothetical protein ACFFC7_33535 [Candidatus Hermodarchaeota archaeon]
MRTLQYLPIYCNNNGRYGICVFGLTNVTLTDNICDNNGVTTIHISDPDPNPQPTTTLKTSVTTRDPNLTVCFFLFLIMIGFLLIVLWLKKD